jgi:hypothetical protein
MNENNYDYMEARAEVLNRLAETADLTEAQTEDCRQRLRDLVSLGEEIVAMLEAMDGDEDMLSLCSWLANDLGTQRQLLHTFLGDDSEVGAAA